MFLLLAVAVHYNALFRQVRPTLGGSTAAEPPLALSGQPRPKAASECRGRASRGRRGRLGQARHGRGARQSRPPAGLDHQRNYRRRRRFTKPDAASPDTIRAIQRELRQKGYGNLSSDGTLRPQTRAAIMAYE